MTTRYEHNTVWETSSVGLKKLLQDEALWLKNSITCYGLSNPDYCNHGYYLQRKSTSSPGSTDAFLYCLLVLTLGKEEIVLFCSTSGKNLLIHLPIE